MSQRIARAIVPLLILTFIACTGCRKNTGAVEASPEKARESLKQGLEAWKGGKNQDAIQAEGITFADSDLEKGMKLIKYEVQGDGQSDGFDWQMKVTLSLEDDKGNKGDKRAVYNINTSPKVVIVRKEF